MDRDIAEQVELLMQGTAYGDPGLAAAMAAELRQRLERGGRRPPAACVLRLRSPHRGPAPRPHGAPGEAAPVPGSRPRGDGRGGDLHVARGDPSDKREGRELMRRDEVRRNGRTYAEQAFRILDPARTRVAFNDEWLSRIGLEEFARPGVPIHGPAARRQGQLQGPVGSKRADPSPRDLLPDPPGPGRVRAAGRRAGRRIGSALQHRHCFAAADGGVRPRPQRGGHRRIASRHGWEDEDEQVARQPHPAAGVRRGHVRTAHEPADEAMRTYFDLLTALPGTEVDALLAGHPLSAKTRLAAR